MVSFKLETDAQILDQKVQKAFKENSSDHIVGNLLGTRDREIWIYDKSNTSTGLAQSERFEWSSTTTGVFEELIVNKLTERLN